MRISSSYIWATLIAAGVIIWMVSDDYLAPASDNFSEIAEAQAQLEADSTEQVPNFIVAAREVANAPTELQVRASGVTAPSFRQPILVRRSGTIARLLVEEGARIKAGEVIAELATGTLAVELVAAQAERDAAQKAYEAGQKLLARNLSTELELAQSMANLRASEARIEQIKEQLNFTVITAPQSGQLEELDIQIGEVVTSNQTLGTIIGLAELHLTVPVPQARIAQIRQGNLVRVDIDGFGTFSGEVFRIAGESNPATRTFDVEVLLPNTDGNLRGGMSAEAAIIVDTVPAFSVSPAHLSVTADGALSAKILDPLSRVDEKPVTLVKTEGNLAYISGLTDGDIMLTTGQAFLMKGESVAYEIEKGAE